MGFFRSRLSKHGTSLTAAPTPSKRSSGSTTATTYIKRSHSQATPARPTSPSDPAAAPPAYAIIDPEAEATRPAPLPLQRPSEPAAPALEPFAASSPPEQAYAPFVPTRTQPSRSHVSASPHQTPPTLSAFGSLGSPGTTSARGRLCTSPAPGVSSPQHVQRQLASTWRSSSGVTNTARQFSQRGSGTGRYAEDPLDLLKTFKTVFVVDDSGSMQLESESGMTRWEEARDALTGLVALVKDRDPDGVDVHFLNSSHHLLSCIDPTAIRALFDSVAPEGATPTGAKLEELMLDYLDAIELAKQRKALGKPLPPGFTDPRKRNYLILTDGAASDEVEDVIVSIARRLDESHFPLSQVGFSFVQVGDDPEATAFLEELDDTVASSQGVRDIVDTTPYRGMALSYDLIVKALLGGVNRRFDRRTN